MDEKPKKERVITTQGKYSPTLSDVRVVQALMETLGNFTAAAKKLEVKSSTLRAYLNKRPELQEILLQAEHRMVDIAEVALMRKVSDGDVRCILFVLETKGASRGWARPTNSASSKAVEEVEEAKREIIEIDGIEIEL